VAMRLWSQRYLYNYPLQNVKKRSFGGVFGPVSNFLYGMSQRPFDPSPPVRKMKGL
jgi:hypothetical protein